MGTTIFISELEAVDIYPTYLKGAESIGHTYMTWIFHFGLQIEDSNFEIFDFAMNLVEYFKEVWDHYPSGMGHKGGE